MGITKKYKMYFVHYGHAMPKGLLGSIFEWNDKIGDTEKYH